jgi:serine/threonine-protein kinase
LWIARQLAQGLLSLHQAGFVHGDVKPENVQLRDGCTAVLIDLGFAHRLGEPGSLESEGYVLGTADYLAPERAADPPNESFASDWFSFGVLLYEMLTGDLPFPVRSVGDVLTHSVASRDITPTGVEYWPRELTTLVLNLLCRSASRRPAGSFVVHALVALEIAALGNVRAA